MSMAKLDNQTISAELLEKVIIGNDLAGLNAIEKVQYIKNICQTLGLNPLTRPIQIMKFQGKETPYFCKDATEQLRKINKVSITKIETKILDGGIYVVTAYAQTPDGRQDSSTGVITITGLKGDTLCNTMMKGETKAKRRVTLSICGLGFIDECEVDSIPGAQKIVLQDINLYTEYEKFKTAVSNCKSMECLKNIFEEIKKIDFSSNPDLLKNLIKLKDGQKELFIEGE